jgi:hypothetical protein
MSRRHLPAEIRTHTSDGAPVELVLEQPIGIAAPVYRVTCRGQSWRVWPIDGLSSDSAIYDVEQRARDLAEGAAGA